MGWILCIVSDHGEHDTEVSEIVMQLLNEEVSPRLLISLGLFMGNGYSFKGNNSNMEMFDSSH